MNRTCNKNPPAPLVATRLWGASSKSCNLVSCIPFNPLSFTALYPLHPLLAFYLAAFCLFCCTNPHGPSFLPPTSEELEILGSTPHVQESIQIQRIHQYCTYPQKATPRYQKRLQKVSKSMPKIIEICKNAKIWNLTKTTVFTMFLRGADIRNQRFLQSKIIKNRACNPNMLFDTSTHIKYEQVPQKWSQ